MLVDVAFGLFLGSAEFLTLRLCHLIIKAFERGFGVLGKERNIAVDILGAKLGPYHAVTLIKKVEKNK